MKLFRYILPVITSCLFSTGMLLADPYPGVEDSNFDANEERDVDAVQKFLANKRAILVEDKGGCLSISGDVRFEWQYKHEKHEGLHLVGKDSRLQMVDDRVWWGNNGFDVEVNLYFDYTTECTWARVAIEFDNDAGVSKCCNAIGKSKADPISDAGVRLDPSEDICESGTCSKICVEQAYFGYNVLSDGCCRLDVEIGRRAFYHVFHSRLMFNNRFDGVLAKYSNSFECVGDFYVYGGFFILDEVVDWYGYVFELGMLDIRCCGLDLRYSFIDYRNKGSDREGLRDRDNYCHRKYEYRNSQISFVYHVDSDCWCIDTSLYGGFIYNHAARRREQSDNDKENMAFYVGLKLGSIRCEGDWSVDANYQWVQAQAIQECDNGGIGRGNAAHVCWVSDPAFGKGNYHGFLIEGVYALTDNIKIVAEFEWSEELNEKIGASTGGSGRHKFYKSELEFIYAF